MTNETIYNICLAIVISAPALAGLYMIWWIEQQERKERRNKLLP